MLQHALIILLSGYLVAQSPLANALDDTGHGAGQHGPAAQKNRRSAPERPYGREGDPRKVDRTIRIDMSDAMRYFPDQVRVKRGATIRFSCAIPASCRTKWSSAPWTSSSNTRNS